MNGNEANEIKSWVHPLDKTTYRAFPHEDGPFEIHSERHRIFAEPAAWYRNSSMGSKWEVQADHRECDAPAVEALGAVVYQPSAPRM